MCPTQLSDPATVGAGRVGQDQLLEALLSHETCAKVQTVLGQRQSGHVHRGQQGQCLQHGKVTRFTIFN